MGLADRIHPSLRLLGRHKRFAALAVASLGIAIALNTTMYSVLDAMIRPKLAMREPERLYMLQYYGDYRALIPRSEKNAAVRDGVTFHEGIAGAMTAMGDRLVERGSRLRDARVLNVTPNYFALLGTRPAAGRLLSPADLTADTRPVVLSERMWNQLFPEKRAFESAPILLNGEGRVVVGLLPYSADFPGAYTDVWQLPAPNELAVMPLYLFRLRPGATPAQAQTELNVLAARWRQRTGEEKGTGYRLWGATQPPFRPWRFEWALIASVLSVLLIACANLANLQLARGVSRARELATRAAVGASRADIVAQLLIESAWLALGGLLLGAVLTIWAMRLIDAYIPPTLMEYVARPQVSWRVVVFAVAAMLFCLLLVGLAPALKLSRVDINELLKSGAGTGRSLSARRQYGVLVVTEVALALSLLASAALLMRADFQVRSFDMGIDTRGLVTAYVRLSPRPSEKAITRREGSDRLVNKAVTLDSITGAATTAQIRVTGRAVSIDDPRGVPFVFQAPWFWYNLVSSDYFRVSRIRIVRGRDFSPGEFAEPQAIVDEVAARVMWPGADPVGQLIKLDSAQSREPWLRVVGIAATTERWFNRYQDDVQPKAREILATRSNRAAGGVFVLNASDTAHMSGAKGADDGAILRVVVRGRGDVRRIPMVLRRGLMDFGSSVFVAYPLTAEQSSGVDRLRQKHDFMASLFALFATVALALAALGVYAIIAHMVAQRTREFGVRIAVGAAARDIRELVLREGNVLTLAGIAVGLLITVWSASLVRAFVFSDYDRYDSRLFAAAAFLLFLVALLASYIPARRATRINPVEALRNE